jgi:hypothetical protein
MTIDERLERLTDRHEALTQTVEHLARPGAEQNGRIEKLVTAITKLMTIAENHERRLGNLE